MLTAAAPAARAASAGRSCGSESERAGCVRARCVCARAGHQGTGRAHAEPGLWHDATLNALETRRLIPVADWSGDCCFIGLRETLVQQLHAKGSCWGERFKDEEKEERYAEFLNRCGASTTSTCRNVPSTAAPAALRRRHRTPVRPQPLPTPATPSPTPRLSLGPSPSPSPKPQPQAPPPDSVWAPVPASSPAPSPSPKPSPQPLIFCHA